MTDLLPNRTIDAIDAFGKLSARIAELEAEKGAIRDALIDVLGVGAYEGRLFRITISTSTPNRLDMKAVRAKLSAQFIRANTHAGDPVTTVKATARNNIGIFASKGEQHVVEA